MKDKKWIVLGLVIGLGILTLPLWINLGRAKAMPEVELSAKAKAAGQCVLSKQAMRTQHMKLLDEWREKAVRQGTRTYTAPDGRKFEMSLSNTCMDCHHNREAFCNRCHDYVSVRPYCWDCHVNPANGFKEISQ